MVMSIVYVVPIAFTQRIMYNNLYFVEDVFLYRFLEENSLLNLCLIVCVSYSLCHLILALSINLCDSTYTK